MALSIGKEMSKCGRSPWRTTRRPTSNWNASRQRGFTIHAIVYGLVTTGLIILNLTVATEFPWASSHWSAGASA